jgi:deoxyribodipyrimidine photolyase-like uncharacterized protein
LNSYVKGFLNYIFGWRYFLRNMGLLDFGEPPKRERFLTQFILIIGKIYGYAK